MNRWGRRSLVILLHPLTLLVRSIQLLQLLLLNRSDRRIPVNRLHRYCRSDHYFLASRSRRLPLWVRMRLEFQFGPLHQSDLSYLAVP